MSVYNGEPFLAEALASLMAQTESAWECILVDDASRDGTADTLRHHSAIDGRFRVLTFSQNKGLTRALNEALSLASAPLVARQDADDISLPDRFKRQAEFMDSHPSVAVAGSGYEIMDVTGAPLSVTRPACSPSRLRNQLRHRNPLAHGSLMMRTDALRTAGGYREEFRMAQDYDLVVRLGQTADVAALGDVLYRLRLAPEGGSLSRRAVQDHFAARAGKTTPTGPMSLPGAGPADKELALQRYECLAALHLLKSGRTAEARRRLSACERPELRAVRNRLLLFSRLPSPLRLASLRLKHLWETFA